MRGLDSNTSQTWQGVLMLAMGAVTAMDTGLEKTILLGLGFAVIGIVAIFTRGSGITPDEGRQIKEEVLGEGHQRTLEDVLKEGRE